MTRSRTRPIPGIVRLLAALVVAASSLFACANPFAGDPVTEAGPSRELAETPEALPEEVPTVAPGQPGSTSRDDDGSGPGAGAGSDDDGASGNGDEDGDGGAGSGRGDVQGSDGGVSAGPGGGARATITDRPGDHGLRAPAYADLRGVSLEDRGDVLRITVGFEGAVPARLPEDETQGVGVDLYRRTAQESAYQVFVDGGPEGWFAYFYTPRGFKKYPGTFGIGGRVMVFDVPWRSMQMPGSLGFSAFCDWTRRTTDIVNLFSEDRAPDRGTADFPS